MLNLKEAILKQQQTEDPSQAKAPDQAKSPESQQKLTSCGLFYQTPECFRLLEEALLYSGIGAPVARSCTPATLEDNVAGTDFSLIFIEVSDGLLKRARTLRSLLPQATKVVLIGTEDSIRTLRAVEELGFYYLPWPAEKQDVVSFLQTLRHKANQSPALPARLAMRIAVVGLKGGSGCTMLTSQLAFELAEESQQQVIVVDHGYTGSNMSVMLGKRDLIRQQINSQGMSHLTLGNTLDPVSAQGQLSPVANQISYLGFELELEQKQTTAAHADSLREYSNRVVEALQPSANFIIEDYSAAANFYPHPDWLCTQSDLIILVIQPTLSGQNEARAFLERLQQINDATDTPTRLLLVLNHCRPAAHIERKAVEQYLGQAVAIELPYTKHCESILASGQQLSKSRSRLSLPLTNLTRLILGKPPRKPSLLSWLLT
ncbi:AAA family ATPase [Spongorhabdus nitratireducens]